MENAPAALKKLDKNGDSRLTEDEYRPAFRPGQGFRIKTGKQPASSGNSC